MRYQSPKISFEPLASRGLSTLNSILIIIQVLENKNKAPKDNVEPSNSKLAAPYPSDAKGFFPAAPECATILECQIPPT